MVFRVRTLSVRGDERRPSACDAASEARLHGRLRRRDVAVQTRLLRAPHADRRRDRRRNCEPDLTRDAAPSGASSLRTNTSTRAESGAPGNAAPARMFPLGAPHTGLLNTLKASTLA